MLLEEWLNMESSFGELGDISLVQVKLPKKLKKRRQIASEDGLAGYVIKFIAFTLFNSKIFYLFWCCQIDLKLLKTINAISYMMLTQAGFIIFGLWVLRYWLTQKGGALKDI